jgi:hypothetical protein
MAAQMAATTLKGNPGAAAANAADLTVAQVKTLLGYITGNQPITLSGDVSGSGATAIAAALATVNANVGAFQGITVNAKGLVTAATNQNYAPLASPTFTGTAAFVGTDLTIPAAVTANGATTITWTNGEAQNVNMTGNATIAVSGWPASGRFAKLVLIITNTGAFNITAWPSGTVWAGGAAPTITAGPSVTDIIMLSTNNGGTTIYGNIVGQNYH